MLYLLVATVEPGSCSTALQGHHPLPHPCCDLIRINEEVAFFYIVLLPVWTPLFAQPLSGGQWQLSAPILNHLLYI